MEDELKFYRHFNFDLLRKSLLFGTPKSSPLLQLKLMWLLPFLYQKMCRWVLVYIPSRLYSKNSLFIHFLNSAKLHQKILAQHFFIPTLLCFKTLCKNSLVLTLVWILLGFCLSPIHLKRAENHWMVVLFFWRYVKLKPFLLVFIDVTSNTLSCHIMFLAFSFCVYYKAVSIWRQIKR